MKLFEKILMASEDVKSYLVSGRDDANTHFDGEVVAIGDLVNHEVYANLKDMDTRAISTYTGSGRYGIVDYVGVEEGNIMGNRVRWGIKTAGLEVPVAQETRVRVPQLGDEFYWGDENFSAAPAAGKYAVYDANGLMKPADTAATSGLCVKIEYATNKITGAVNNGKKYFCTVVAI